MNMLRNGILGCKYLHLRCIAHIVNLVVNDGLKEMHESVPCIKGVVRYVRQSFARLAKFKECVMATTIQSKSLLCMDVSTGWNSTYLTLDATQKFGQAFDPFEDVDPYYRSELLMGDGVFDLTDWANVRKLSLFLKQFNKLTIKVLGTSYTTVNTFFYDICIAYCTLCDQQRTPDVDMKLTAKRIKEKFNKYWGNVENSLLYIAVVLDLREKLDFV